MSYHVKDSIYTVPGIDYEFTSPNEAIEAARPDGNVYQQLPPKKDGTIPKRKIFWKWDAFNKSKEKKKN